MNHRKIKLSVISGIAIAICVIELSCIYTNSVLDKVAKTDIPIVDSSTKTISNTNTKTRNYSPSINTDDDEAEDSQVFFNAGSQWGDGRVPVYVNDKYPIQKVERIDSDVENFLLFGVDSRDMEQLRSQADTLIIVSIDSRHRKIKLTSVLRDTQVQVAGKSYSGKLNNVYATGGVGMLINTINQNFHLDIQKFVMVDFWSAACLVDIAGGVEINVTPAEVKWLNLYLDDLNQHFGGTEQTPHIIDSGLQTLSGRQAVAWARIRAIGNDYARTERQRTVIEKLYEKFKEVDLSQKTKMISEGLGLFETNLTNGEIIVLGFNGIFSSGIIEQYRIPEDRFSKIVQDDNIAFNTQAQIDALYHFIYEKNN